MIIFSAFDGISCGQIALERAEVFIEQYYASEIEKTLTDITNRHYPNTIQVGDITKLTSEHLEKLPPIDLMIGGSPCQDLSIYKFDRGDVKGLEGEKSRLFYHYERIFKFIQPKYFLLENVPMESQWENIISELLGVQPIVINSNLVSAADRKRLYWTNIPNITQPSDKGISIKDIILPTSEVPDKYWYKKEFTYNGADKKVEATLHVNSHRSGKEVYNQNFKSSTLTCVSGGYQEKKVFQDGRCRKFMPIEYERMQNIPDDYTKGLKDTARYSAIGNGFTVDILAHIFKNLEEQESIETPFWHQKEHRDENFI